MHPNAVLITPDNARALKSLAAFMDDWFEIGHDDALHHQLCQQMLHRGIDRVRLWRTLGTTCG